MALRPLLTPQLRLRNRFFFWPYCQRPRTWLRRAGFRVISSVVERFVHIEDVRSSNLLSPTILLLRPLFSVGLVRCGV